MNIRSIIDSYGDCENKDIIINDNYYILLTEKNGGNIDIDLYNLNIQCPDKENFQFNLDYHSKDIDIYSYIIKNDYLSYLKYISFSLDLSTILKINDIKNYGGLLNKGELSGKNAIRTIKLGYNKNLDISENYFIYLGEKREDYFYDISSNFCMLKVINCHDGCEECNINIVGTDENHQCTSCLKTLLYYKLETNLNSNNYFNCYKEEDAKKLGYYLVNNDYYNKCHESCNTCSDISFCETCKTGYYHKVNKNNNIILDICYKDTPKYYYLNTDSNFVFKECYQTCETCFGDGTINDNKCITCRNDYLNYAFDLAKCTQDIDKCSNKFWFLDGTNNIQCNDKCDDYIIHPGINNKQKNKYQCVQNCQSYINPFSLSQSEQLLTYRCGNDKYCITSSYCELKKFKPEDKICKNIYGLCADMSNDEPGTIPTEDTTDDSGTNSITDSTSDTTHSTDYNENGKYNTTKRVKLIKYYEFEKIRFSLISDNFILNQIEKYKLDLNKELNAHIGEYLGGIDFITCTKYKDFTITMYPLQVEDYIYTNLFEMNNLSFVNFTQLFNDLKYEIKNENEQILIGLIEYEGINIPINLINYFFCIYNERENIIYQIKNLNNTSSFRIDVAYHLFNFENSNIPDKYSKNLISTIKNLHSIDEDLTFYNIDDKLYNDICYTFKSNENVDIAVEDRIKDYYIKLSLCENNCTLINIINKDKKENPRSLCRCQIKNDILFSNDSYTFINETYDIKKVKNINALKCVNAFSSKNISKNYIFWIIIIFFGVLIFLFIFVCFCSNNSIENLLKVKKTYIKKEKEKNRVNYDLINDFDKKAKNDNIKKNKSVKIIEISNNNSQSVDNYKRQIYQTNPQENSESNPPKKINDLIAFPKKEYIISTKREILIDEKNDININKVDNYNIKIWEKMINVDENKICINTESIKAYKKNNISINGLNSNNNNKLNDEKKQLILPSLIINKTNKLSDIDINFEKNKNIYEKYWNILKKREIILYTICSTNIPLFIRIPTFLLIISFHFAINCLLLTSDDIHKRYIYKKEHDKINEIKYILNNEFSKCIISMILFIVIKIILIKSIYGILFNKSLILKKNNNKIFDEKNNKNDFIKKYKKISLIYISIVLLFIFLFGYVAVSYVKTFPNSEIGIEIKFIISFFFSIVFCFILCSRILICFFRLNNNVINL